MDGGLLLLVFRSTWLWTSTLHVFEHDARNFWHLVPDRALGCRIISTFFNTSVLHVGLSMFKHPRCKFKSHSTCHQFWEGGAVYTLSALFFNIIAPKPTSPSSFFSSTPHVSKLRGCSSSSDKKSPAVGSGLLL
jgi:hypothetical protein